MGITRAFGVMIDLISGNPRRWYMRGDGVKRWVSNDMPCLTSNENDAWKCTKCGRVGAVGRCCGEDTREQAKPNETN
jgi:hypothetical protein